jgi:membrane protein
MTGGRNNGPGESSRHRLATAAAFFRYALARFNQDRCFAAAGALSYTTLVSLVPLGVIAFSILSIFPTFGAVRQQLLAMVFRDFVPTVGEQAAYWFESFANSAAQSTAVGLIGIAGTGLLLLTTVEDQLNLIWRISVPRPWGQRILAYWTLLTLGPLLVGTSLTLSTYFELAARHAGLDPEQIANLASSWLNEIGRWLPFVLEFIACTLLYSIIPNCAVRWRDAALGAICAAVAIQFLKLGFTTYILTVSSYQTVYGALAIVPIFLLWLYITWMAVLLGAVVAANLPTWQIDERLGQLGVGGVQLGLALALIAALARAQRSAFASRSTAILARELGVATTALAEHLNRLAQAGFIAPTQAGGWVLAWNPENATLFDLYRALDLPLARGWSSRRQAPWQARVAPAMDRIVAAETAAMRVSLAELIAETEKSGVTPLRAIADATGSE